MPTRALEEQIIFSDFMAKLDKGDFEKVIIQGHQISGVLKDNFRLHTYSADYPDLVNVLRTKNVQIEVKPPEENRWYIQFLMTWGAICSLSRLVGILHAANAGRESSPVSRKEQGPHADR